MLVTISFIIISVSVWQIIIQRKKAVAHKLITSTAWLHLFTGCSFCGDNQHRTITTRDLLSHEWAYNSVPLRVSSVEQRVEIGKQCVADLHGYTGCFSHLWPQGTRVLLLRRKWRSNVSVFDKFLFYFSFHDWSSRYLLLWSAFFHIYSSIFSFSL